MKNFFSGKTVKRLTLLFLLLWVSIQFYPSYYNKTPSLENLSEAPVSCIAQTGAVTGPASAFGHYCCPRRDTCGSDQHKWWVKISLSWRWRTGCFFQVSPDQTSDCDVVLWEQTGEWVCGSASLSQQWQRYSQRTNVSSLAAQPNK